MVHAEANAMWDLRRLPRWIRAQGGKKIGVYGLSLGGYNAALLACLDDEPRLRDPGHPAADLDALVWRHGPRSASATPSIAASNATRVERVLRVVSPLALAPLRAERAALDLRGGRRPARPGGPRPAPLVAHWDEPRTLWYEGAHLSFGAHGEVARHLAEALRGAGLA